MFYFLPRSSSSSSCCTVSPAPPIVSMCEKREKSPNVAQRELPFRRSRRAQFDCSLGRLTMFFPGLPSVLISLAAAAAHSPARFSLGESRWRDGRKGEIQYEEFTGVYMQVPSKHHSLWVAPKVWFNEKKSKPKPKERANFQEITASCTLWSEHKKRKKKENIPGLGALL